MSASQLDTLLAQATTDAANNANVVDSAIIIINGIQAGIDAAVATALAAGATPAELQAITDLNTKIESETASLSAAVASRTPVAATPAGKASGAVK